MGKHREVITYGNAYTVAAVTRSLMFMVIFWFAGCAAGSCLSYGHSCWGAHGKRSGHNYAVNGPEDDDRPSLSVPSSNEGGQQPLQDQWILSRLVTRQLIVPGPEKFRGNWYDTNNRGRGGHGRNWDTNDIAVVSENAKSLRRDEIEIENEDESEDDDLREEAVVLPRVMSRETREQVLEPREMSDVDADELVLVPPTDNHLKPIGQSHKLRLFKILNGAAEKLK